MRKIYFVLSICFLSDFTFMILYVQKFCTEQETMITNVPIIKKKNMKYVIYMKKNRQMFYFYIQFDAVLFSLKRSVMRFFKFLCGAPTSMCHFFTSSISLSVHLSVHLLYTISQELYMILSQFLVHLSKMMISPGSFSFFFLIMIF